MRAKPDASIVQAARAVAEGRADALVSAGSTGATLAAGLLQIKRMRGVYRPGLAVLLPVPGRPTLLLDVGATVEVRPEQLVQFAFMGVRVHGGRDGGDAPARRTAERRRGAGEGHARRRRGARAAGRARRTLRSSSPATSRANGLVSGQADVVVTDGFTGNVALKLMEGTTRTVVGAIRDAIRSGTTSKLGGLLIRSRLGELRERLDPESVGGAYLLGLRGLAIVCHGSSSRRAIASAIALAERGVEEQVTAAHRRRAGGRGRDPRAGRARAGFRVRPR